jgi:lysophospholipase L1-like esterase
MKQKKQSLISALTVFCMIISLFTFLSPVSSAEEVVFVPTYSDEAIQSDWSGTKDQFTQFGGWAFYRKNWGASNAYLVYDKQQWQNNLTYKIRIDNEGSTPGKKSTIYFFYQNMNNYYALDFYNTEGDDTTPGGVKLIKTVNGNSSIIAEAETYFKMKEHTLTLTRSSDGTISAYVNEKDSGTRIDMFTVVDTDLTYGKIGFGFDGDGARFDGIYVSGTAYVPEGDQEVSAQETEYKLPSQSGPLPEGWSGDVSGVECTYNWGYGHVNGVSWGVPTAVVYDNYIWQDDFSYSTRINNNGSTPGARMELYFMYQDDKNYYALYTYNDDIETAENPDMHGIVLVKVKDGQESVLARANTFFKAQQQTFIINHTADGEITVNYKDKDGYDVKPLIETVKDTDFTKGKIGFGWNKDGGFVAELTVKGMAYDPSQTPPPSGIPDTSDYVTVYKEDFDNISDAEKLKWSTIVDSGVSITGGNIAGNWCMGLMVYTGQNFNAPYKYKVDISNNNGGDLGNSGDIVFNWQTAGQYYYVQFEGTEQGTVKLCKVNGNHWAPETIAEYDGIYPTKYKTVTVEIIYEEGGYITVTGTIDGETTVLFNRVRDLSYTGGKIGVLSRYSQTMFDNIEVSQPSDIAPTPSPEPNNGLVSEADPADKKAARRLGRAYVEDGILRFNWSMSGIEFAVGNATEVQLDITKDYVNDYYIGVAIDGSDDYERVYVHNGLNTIARFDTPGDHVIRVVSLTEAILNHASVTNIKVYGTEDKIAGIYATKPRERKMEFVGDSITAGYGILGGTGLKPETQDPSLTYAGQTAKHFGADMSVVAASGKGLLSGAENELTQVSYDYCKFNTSDEKYLWDFTSYVPDVIVVNIGTNDQNKDQTLLCEEYKKFIRQIRDSYEDKTIPIIMGIGPMTFSPLTAIEEAVEAVGDPNVYSLRLGITDGWQNPSGADFHPNVEDNEKMAGYLIEKINEILPEWNTPAQNVPITGGVYVGDTVRTDDKISVSYNAFAKEGGSLLAALFDENGELSGFRYQSIPEGVSYTGEIEFNLSGLDGGEYTPKLFLWDGESMAPLTDVTSVDAA